MTEYYRHKSIMRMVSEVLEYFNELILEDTIGATEDQDTDPNDNELDSNDNKIIAPSLVSPEDEEQSNPSLDESSIDES